MGSWKLEKDVRQADLPQFLRELAQALESGQADGALSGLPPLDALAGLRKLVLVAECREGGLRLKLKAKRQGELLVREKKAAQPNKADTAAQAGQAAQPRSAVRLSDAEARTRDKYRQLKKALQADYKALHKAAQAGVMPAQDLLESFLGLCEAMAGMAQPAQGAAAAELLRAGQAFLEDARALRRAVAARDVARLAEALARLERRKSACHAQFK